MRRMKPGVYIPMKPGVYVLNQDVSNPEPDRRRRDDWKHFLVWSKGMEVVIESSLSPSFEGVLEDLANTGLSDEAKERLRESMTSYTMEPTNPSFRVGAYRTNSNEMAFLAIAEHLVPCNESIASLFVRLGVTGTDGNYFLRYLLREGILSRKDFEHHYTTFQYGRGESDE